MLVAVYLLYVIGSSWAQSGLNDLQVRTPEAAASTPNMRAASTQMERSAQQFRIPNVLPNFRSSDRPQIQTNQFTNNLGGFTTGFFPPRIGPNNWVNSNGLLMMFPSRSGRMVPGISLNRPAPIANVFGRPALPLIPQTLHPFRRGRNPINFGQRFTGLSLNHQAMLGAHRPNPTIPRGNNVVTPQVNPSTTQSRRPVTTNAATRRLVDFILGRRGNQNNIQTPTPSQTNSIVETTNPSQSVAPELTGDTSNTNSFANKDVNQATSNTRFRSKTDEEIRREAQERLRQINAILSRAPPTARPRIANMINNQILPPSTIGQINNINRRMEPLDQNTLNRRIQEALKNRDKSSNTPVVVDGGFATDVMPPLVVDGGVSWSNQGVLIDHNQRRTSVNLETDQEFAKHFPVPS